MGQGQDPKQPGSFLLEGLQNGMTYYVRLQGMDDPAEGGYSDPAPIMPKSDPDMPSGAFLIEDGAAESKTRNVMLTFSATDRPLDGAAQSSAAHMTDQISQQYNTVSGNIQVRVGNDADLTSAAWQPLVQELPWTLDCPMGEICRVYAQFRDGARTSRWSSTTASCSRAMRPTCRWYRSRRGTAECLWQRIERMKSGCAGQLNPLPHAIRCPRNPLPWAIRCH